MHHPQPRAKPGARASILAIATTLVVTAATVGAPGATAANRAAGGDSVAPRPTAELAPANAAWPSFDSLFGRSGKVRFRRIGEGPAFALPVLRQLFGDSAPPAPGVYSVDDSASGRRLALISMLPFSAKTGGKIGTYLLGFWPGERKRKVARTEAYENPEGFIRVTEDNQETYVSEHFQLRDFLTHDQRDVWPKYLVLREDLVDKLELVIDDLREHGVAVKHVVVMSGFRTPSYNAEGVGRGGRARDSRHQFGDAADIFIDNDGNGRMDDVNRDGRVNTRDARVIQEAVERVERAHPDLVGGVGLYRATRAHGPFAHIDVRGYRARWGRA
jgi:uncharacterized protein YcbK (DUF882 family)